MSGQESQQKVQIMFQKPIRDTKLQTYLLLIVGFRRGNYVVWKGDAIVGLIIDRRDWLDLVSRVQIPAKWRV